MAKGASGGAWGASMPSASGRAAVSRWGGAVSGGGLVAASGDAGVVVAGLLHPMATQSVVNPSQVAVRLVNARRMGTPAEIRW
jgi:hypothetical protein